MEHNLIERIKEMQNFTSYKTIDPLIKEFQGYVKDGYSETFAIEIMEIKYVPRVIKFALSDQV